MKRIVLFLATNLAIIIVLSITLRLLGVERILDEQGIGLDINSLLIFAAVFGFGGSFISLAISKWTAKRITGALLEKSGAARQRAAELAARIDAALGACGTRSHEP